MQGPEQVKYRRGDSLNCHRADFIATVGIMIALLINQIPVAEQRVK